VNLKKNVKNGFLIFLLVFGTYGIYFLYRIDKPVIIKPFPDPFIFNNGTQVKDEEDWQARREEIKELLLDEEYGHMPGRPDALNATEISSEVRADGSIAKVVELSIIPSNETPNTMINFIIWIYIPSGAGPFPTIVKVGKDGIGSEPEMNQKIVSRGYIYVCYSYTDLEPDTMGYDVDGPCQAAYPGYDWGSIAVWAWGAMRVADYLLGEIWVNAPDGIPNVDSDKLIITGHSRRGKTALLAGALDERFAMVAPNGSGCGGAGSFLVQGYLCETIATISSESRWKSWFQEDFNKYGNNEKDLTFDQHFLLALVAPRIIFSTNKFEDFWQNPVGTQAIYEAVAPVFEFLGVEENNAIHYSHGIHSFIEEDFEVIMDLADKLLLGKDVSGDFYMTPYDIDFKIDYEIPD